MSDRYFAHFALASLLITACGDSEHARDTAATRQPGPPPPKHIVILSIDTLRYDHLGCYGYPAATSPAIDRLAANGTVFEQTQATRGATWPSLTSMLTGKYPITHGVRSNGVRPREDEVMLMHHLRRAGYATGAFLSNYDQAMPNPDDRGLDRLVAGFKAAEPQHKWDERVTRAALRWIENHRDEMAFTWLHLMLPHRPYQPPPGTESLVAPYEGWVRDGVPISRIRKGGKEGRIDIDDAGLDAFLDTNYPRTGGTYREISRGQQDQLSMDQALDLITLEEIDLRPADRRYVNSRYDAEIRGADNLLAEVIARVEELGLTHDTLFIFTSDHGEEMYDHNQYFFHGASIYQGVVQIPFVMAWPGHVPAKRVGDVVEIVDIMPTVLEILGIPQPPEVEGESLWPLVTSGKRLKKTIAVTELHQKVEKPQPAPMDAIYAVRDRRWKLILNLPRFHPRTAPYVARSGVGFAIEAEELYDLETDPLEQTDLLTTNPDQSSATPLDRARHLASAFKARSLLTAEFRRWLSEHAKRDIEIDETISPELREQLASLGYVDGAPIANETPIEPSAIGGDLARRVFEAASAADDTIAEAVLLRSESQAWMGNWDAARSLATQALELADDEQREIFKQRISEALER